MFGVSLEELAVGSSHKVPFIVRKIVEHIEENGVLEWCVGMVCWNGVLEWFVGMLE